MIVSYFLQVFGDDFTKYLDDDEKIVGGNFLPRMHILLQISVNTGRIRGDVPILRVCFIRWGKVFKNGRYYLAFVNY